MKIRDIYVKEIVSKITYGSIKGQGDKKKYTFLILVTDQGTGISEIYCGTYGSRLLKEIVRERFKILIGSNLSFELISKNFLHQPFISGSGLVEVLNSAFYNAFFMIFKKSKFIFDNLPKLKLYASGGTISSSIDQIREEIKIVLNKKLNCIKIRMDHRNIKDSLERIKLLQSSKCKFAIDLIINTNHIDQEKIQLDLLLNKKLNILWIEEPFFPSNGEMNWSKSAEIIKSFKYKIALGESMTSLSELHYLILNKNIDIIQIDSSHSSDYLRLSKFLNKNSDHKIFGVHNWGSCVSQIQNLYLLNISNLESTIWWEVPLFKTEFDKEILNNLNVKNRFELHLKQLINFDSIIDLIINYKEVHYKDYSWT